MKVLCIIPILIDDIKSNEVNLINSISSLREFFSGKIKFLAIIQPNINDFKVHTGKHNFFDYEIVQNSKSVSKARNTGLDYAFDNNYTHIFFLDASIAINKVASNFLYNSSKCDKICKGIEFFGKETDKLLNLNSESKEILSSKLNPYFNCYLWTFLFPIKTIGSIRFNTNFGPGDGNRYTSGEDLLFIYEIFNKNIPIIINNSVKFYHPIRDKNYSKHMKYASGQGRVLRYMLDEKLNFRILITVFLFFLNSIFRIVIFKPNSLAILVYRYFGFFKKYDNY